MTPRCWMVVGLLTLSGCGLGAGPPVTCEVLPDEFDCMEKTVECKVEKDLETLRIIAEWDVPGSSLNPHGKTVSAHDVSAGKVRRVERIRVGAKVTIVAEGGDYRPKTFTIPFDPDDCDWREQ